MVPEKNELLPDNTDAYKIKFNASVKRTGKIFSYTFWRTQIRKDVFWSVQGHNDEGLTWVTTQYFGPPEQASKYQQIVVLTHPVETKINMVYYSGCNEGQNRIIISRTMMQHFKNDDNSFNFEFKIVRTRRKPFRMYMSNV